MRTTLCLNPIGILIKRESCHLFASFLHDTGMCIVFCVGSERFCHRLFSFAICRNLKLYSHKRPSQLYSLTGDCFEPVWMLALLPIPLKVPRDTTIKWQSGTLWGTKTLTYTHQNLYIFTCNFITLYYTSETDCVCERKSTKVMSKWLGIYRPA
jgi:hypothetical protein